MIDKGVTYVYATGGEAFVFFTFDPHDVHTLYYDWIVPQADVPAANNDMSKSAVGLVASFAQLAVQGLELDSNWTKAMRKIVPVWAIEDIKMTEQPTPSPLQASKPSPPYKGKGKPSNDGSDRLARSKTRLLKKTAAGAGSRRDEASPPDKNDDDDDEEEEEDDDDQGNDHPPAAAASRPDLPGEQSGTIRTTKTATHLQERSKSDNKDRQRIYWAFCAQWCLLGLVRGLQLDKRCPNFDAHRQVRGGSRHHHGRHRRGRGCARQQGQHYHHNDRAGLWRCWCSR